MNHFVQGIRTKLHQRGATAVEFALISIFLFSLLFGIADFSRWLFTLNAAVEATRLGARIAAVCDQNAPGIKTRMLGLLPEGTNASNITLNYLNDSCAAGEVCTVQVSLSGVTIPSLTWVIPGPIAIPALSTSLPRESLQTTINGASNPDCT